MQSIRVTGEVDKQHQLVATLPDSIPPGSVEVLVISHADGNDEAGLQWIEGIAREWHDELSDSREDIYTLKDGIPADGAR
jgi:hypothetical protein